MRLARIPCSSARHPSYSALCPPLTGVARAGGGRGSPFAWLLGHACHYCGFIPGALRSSCMSSALSPSSVPPPGRIRGEGVCDVTLRSVKPGRPWCPGGRVLRVLRSDRFPIIPSTAPKHRNNKSGNGKARGAKPQKHSPGPKRNDLKERFSGLQGIMHMRVVLSRISPYLNNHS